MSEDNKKSNSDFESFSSIMKHKKQVKPPAYQWQELALQIINDLSIPNFKRSSVFRICKVYSEKQVRQALIDTKELCPSGPKWKYFFKVVSSQAKDNKKTNDDKLKKEK
jgi:hypothetical protein